MGFLQILSMLVSHVWGWPLHHPSKISCSNFAKIIYLSTSPLLTNKLLFSDNTTIWLSMTAMPSVEFQHEYAITMDAINKQGWGYSINFSVPLFFPLSFQKDENTVWIIIHCLGLGHETMVCAVCLSIFVCSYLTGVIAAELWRHLINMNMI